MDFADVLALARKDQSVATRALEYIGRPTELAVRATLESVEALNDVRAEALAILRSSRNEREATSALSSWAARRRSIPALTDIVSSTLAKGDLGGAMFVRDVEATPQLLKLDALSNPPPTFLNLPFTEAVDFARRRGLVDDESLVDLLRNYRERGEEVSEGVLRRVQTHTANALTRWVERGGTLTGFIDDIETAGASFGVGPRDHAYLENVFRTGVQSAYGAGRYRGLADPAVIEALPIRIYRTVGDGRVRAEHAPLDGFKWDARASNEWSLYAPPNGYRCRCSMVSGFADEATAAELALQVPDEAAIDPDFFGPPDTAIEAPITRPAPPTPPTAPQPPPVPAPSETPDQARARRLEQAGFSAQTIADDAAESPVERTPQGLARVASDALRGRAQRWADAAPPLGEVDTDSRASVRRFIRTIDPRFASHDVLGAANDHRTIKVEEYRGAVATHDWNGKMTLSPREARKVGGALRDLAAGRDPGRSGWDGIATIVHEEHHGASRIQPRAYRGIGARLEEAMVELRTRQHILDLAQTVGSDSFGERPPRVRNGSVQADGVGAYQREVEGFVEAVSRATGLEGDELDDLLRDRLGDWFGNVSAPYINDPDTFVDEVATRFTSTESARDSLRRHLRDKLKSP